MPSAILHVGATVTCPHPPGVAQPQAWSLRVMVGGQAVVTIAHAWAIGGCGATGSVPSCVEGHFQHDAARVRVENSPVATVSSPSTVVGSAAVLTPVTTQTRVKAD